MIYIIIILIVLDALKDSLYDRGAKTISGVIDLVYLSVMICGVVLMHGDWIWIVIYVCLRYALFDLIYNLIREKEIFYIGTTKPIDILIRRIFHENAVHFLFITKLVALISAVALMFFNYA